MTSPNQPRITVRGPAWRAQVTIVQEALTDAQTVRQTRHLFVDASRYEAGTLVVLCHVHDVQVEPQAGLRYTWQRPATDPIASSATVAEVRAAKASGALALLLLVETAEGQYLCIGGEICLDVLPAAADDANALYTALGIERDAQTVPGRWEISVHASGVSLHARFAWPWIRPRLRGPLLLSPALDRASNEAPPGYRLRIEAERLTSDEANLIILAWQALSRYLNPRNPLLPGALNAPVPTWATLEVADPLAVPNLYWKIDDFNAPLPRDLFAESDAFALTLSDQQPADAANPTASAATVALGEVAFAGDLDTGLTLTATNGQAAPNTTQLAYRWNTTDATRDQITLRDLQVAYSPVETPEALRAYQRLVPPQWSPGSPTPIEPAVLWGFMPLDRGWAQLPVLNLTEQMLLDAELANVDGPTTPAGANLMRGAVAFGNAQDAILAQHPDENPWSVAIIRVQALRGTWQLTPLPDNDLQLSAVTLDLGDPDVILNGFLWLSTGRPSVQDALPDLADWIGGLASVPLRSNRPTRDLFPAPVIMAMSTLNLVLRSVPGQRPSAELMAWEMAMRAQQSVLDKLLQKRVLPPDVFSALLPLLWLRHATVPMIQALPLTQAQTPPRHPSASRELVPFALTTVDASLTISDDGARPLPPVYGVPDDWRFGVVAGNGADQWAEVLLRDGQTLLPASEWTNHTDLPLVALSLPGLQLDPRLGATAALPPDPTLALPGQWRYDLPYSDQLNALAELPAPQRDPNLSTPQADDPPEPQPTPLFRADYNAYWQSLSVRASLARLAAADAVGRDAGAGAVIRALLEPYTWPVQTTADLSAYPGTLTIDNRTQPDAPLTLTGETALEGISGHFTIADDSITRAPDDASNGNSIHVRSGSAPAWVEGTHTARQFRDQRGLLRGPTRTTGDVLRTPVALHETLATTRRVELVTALRPYTLQAGAGTWSFWFRDLPMAQPENHFQRGQTLSPAAEDINDPEASSREYNYRNGYEWRLGQTDQLYLTLYNLHVYPLSLEDVVFDGDGLVRVALLARLQLPLSATDPAELDALSNAVRLTFQADASGQLALTTVELVGAVAEWPLLLEAGETTDAPTLTWTQITYDPVAAQLTLGGVALHYMLFDAAWTLPLADLTFGQGITQVTQRYQFVGDQSKPVAPVNLDLTLDLTAYTHEARMTLALQLGDRGGAASARGVFSAQIAVTLVQHTPAPPYSVITARLFGDVPIATSDLVLVFTRQAFQVRWYDYDRAQVGDLQLLPGMHLIAAGEPGAGLPGFATVSFAVLRQLALPTGFDPAAPDALTSLRAALATADILVPEGAALTQVDGQWALRQTGQTDTLQQTDAGWVITFGVPHLQLRTSFLEMIINSAWGTYLQTDGLVAGQAREQAFGSSAGNLSLNYSTRWDRQKQLWTASYLLNGMLEVMNLVSWPQGLIPDAAQPLQMRLPAAQLTQQPLPHTRHSLRVLFNQHEIPTDLLVTGGADLIFDFAPARAWQVLAVVQHQLVDVTLDANGIPATLSNDRRWSALQEVRLLQPQQFAVFLRSFNGATVERDPWVLNYGYLSEDLLRSLAAGDDNELARLTHPALIVEASAPHFVYRGPLADGLGQTDLQYLPGGAQNATLSALDDYARPPQPGQTPPEFEPDWALLTMPFVGRLQDRALDLLDIETNPPSANSSGLQVDPILRLLAHLRADAGAIGRVGTAAIFSNHALGADPIDVQVAVMDQAAGRTWARLDPLSLEENWLRLQNPPREATAQGISGIMAALPDSPARTSRSRALRAAFDTFRRVVIPGTDPQSPPIPDTSGTLVWRQGHLFVLQATEVQTELTTTRATVPYTVQTGDTAARIAQRYESSRAELQDANPDVDLDALQAGQQINVVLPFAVHPQPYVVLAGDSAAELNTRYGDGSQAWLDALLLANQLGDAAAIDTQTTLWLPIFSGAGDSIEALQACWLGHQSGSTRWRIYNPHRDPLSTNPEVRVLYDWFALDANGNVLQSAQRQQTGGIVQVNTQRAERLRVEWYLRTGNTIGERLSSVEIVAGAAAQCDDDWPRQQPPVGQVPPLRAPYAWHMIAPQFSGWNNPNAASKQYAAATLMPIPKPRADRPGDEYPVSFAISPYMSIDFAPARATQPRLIYAELLCLDPATQDLVPVASQLYDLDYVREELKKTEQAEADTNNDSTPCRAAQSNADLARCVYDELSLAWARALQRQLAPDTPIAILRYRTVNDNVVDAPGEAALTTTFSYALVDDLRVQARLARRMFRIRTTPDALRFRHGQYAGPLMPASARPFELAPPQTVGAQPIYFNQQPTGHSDSDERVAAWPWGVSALRVSVHYTEGRQGVVADAGTPTLWWQAPQTHVQFRSSLEATGPSAGLPPLFRAPAIRSLLPVLPDAPLPTINSAALYSIAPTPDMPQIMTQWQPILPGHLRYLLVGNRAGAYIALRNMLLRQSKLDQSATGVGLVSGSVPAQHRMPRPVALPANANAARALQTWASRFEALTNALITDAPADEAFFAACGTTPMRRLRLTLVEPANGVIPSGWDGSVVVEVLAQSAAEKAPWVLTPATVGQHLALSLVQGTGTPRQYALVPQDRALLDDISAFENDLPRMNQDPASLNPTLAAALRAQGASVGDDATVTAVTATNGSPTWRITSTTGEPLLLVTVDQGLRAYREAERYHLRYQLVGGNTDATSGILNSEASGQITLRGLVNYTAGVTDGFRQALALPLRLGDAARLPLPLAPRFTHFEDPEYNRSLASTAATGARNVPVFRLEMINDEPTPTEKHLLTVGLAADRREYNPDSELALRYDWLSDVSFSPEPRAVVQLRRVTTEGAQFNLASYALTASKLKQIQLGALRGPNGEPALQPGDVLELLLFVGGDVDATIDRQQSAVRVVEKVPEGGLQNAVDSATSALDPFMAQVVRVTVDVVSESVIPVPQAGYALLHAQTVAGALQVACARFAWNPPAARVELICPDDLLDETVRRRAVFQWQHSIRPGRQSTLQVQKITNSGSTHTPRFTTNEA